MQQNKASYLRNRLRLVFLLVAFACVFAIYRISLGFSSFLQPDPDLTQLYQSNVGQVLDIGQTVEDVTVRINWMYADQNRVTIALSMINDKKRYHPTELILTDKASGADLSLVTGFGTDDVNFLSDSQIPAGHVQNVFSFNTAPILTSPNQLNLHLKLTLEEIPNSYSADLGNTSVYQHEDGTTTTVVQELSLQNRTVGPFIFDFDVPLDERTTIYSEQIVTVANIPITLKDVVITPSQTRITLCFNEPQESEHNWSTLTSIDIQSQSQTISLEPQSQRTVNERGCTVSQYASLLSYTGTVTVNVTELIGFNQRPSGKQIRIEGPWLFTFDLKS